MRSRNCCRSSSARAAAPARLSAAQRRFPGDALLPEPASGSRVSSLIHCRTACTCWSREISCILPHLTAGGPTGPCERTQGRPDRKGCSDCHVWVHTGLLPQEPVYRAPPCRVVDRGSGIVNSIHVSWSVIYFLISPRAKVRGFLECPPEAASVPARRDIRGNRRAALCVVEYGAQEPE